MISREIEEFLFLESRLLDQKRFEEWMELFAEDGYYWVPARPGQKSPLNEVSLFWDDREIMRIRFQRLRNPRIHAQIPPSRTVHLVSNVVIENDPPPEASHLVSSSMIVFEYRPGGEQRVFGGRCIHALRAGGSAFKIAWKRVDLVNCDSTFGPLCLPL